LQKYNEAAAKIQTRYRAYKSLSHASPKAYQYHRANSYNKNTSKLLSQFHHSSIDETTSTCSNYSGNSSFNLNENSNSMTSSGDFHDIKHMMISSDMQINNQYGQQQQLQSAISSASLSNQRQISRKLMSARQSARFSPATPSPMSPISPTLTPSNSSLIINNSSQQQQQHQIHSPGMTLSFEHQQHPNPLQYFANYDFNKSHTDVHQQTVMSQQMISMDHP
jgi:hypothetical protein